VGDQTAGGRADLKPLTSLRFVAAMMVFFHHFPPTAHFAGAYSLGPAGLGFFFLLSGFILTHTYHRDFTGALVSGRIRSFYVARIARIYPIYIATTVIAILAVMVPGGEPWTGTRQAVSEVLLLQAWSPDPSAVNPPAWSISAEAFFYALFPFAAWWALRIFKNERPSAILAAAAIIWLIPAVIFQLRGGQNLWRCTTFRRYGSSTSSWE
jgi:peptidoglycan/LPS O-acetylase OafA/YrhL